MLRRTESWMLSIGGKAAGIEVEHPDDGESYLMTALAAALGRAVEGSLTSELRMCAAGLAGNVENASMQIEGPLARRGARMKASIGISPGASRKIEIDRFSLDVVSNGRRTAWADLRDWSDAVTRPSSDPLGEDATAAEAAAWLAADCLAAAIARRMRGASVDALAFAFDAAADALARQLPIAEAKLADLGPFQACKRGHFKLAFKDGSIVAGSSAASWSGCGLGHPWHLKLAEQASAVAKHAAGLPFGKSATMDAIFRGLPAPADATGHERLQALALRLPLDAAALRLANRLEQVPPDDVKAASSFFVGPTPKAPSRTSPLDAFKQ